jgi:DNA-binding PadR family transcriptional regulator
MDTQAVAIGDAPLPLADQVCLAVIGEAPTHGWAIVTLLRPDGELGRVWTLTRPLTYRAIDRLVDSSLADRHPGGRRATLLITAAGRSARTAWLDQPVDHVRDLRTVFLLKLLLRRRATIGGEAEFCARQLAHLEPAIHAVTAQQSGDPVEIWRHESAQAARRTLARLAGRHL